MPSPLLIVIGLDEPLVDRLRSSLDARIVAYPGVPRVHALDGKARVESARVAGKWLEPDGVIFYSYFDDARDARRALAIANTPTFPDVRATLPLDDKVLGLVAAVRADGESPARGYVPANESVEFEGERVVKWGDKHCGEGKARATSRFAAEEPTVIEGFVHGVSERVLIVGEHAWQLRYESDDWRKNVRATVREVAQSDRLVERARRTAKELGLVIAGIDYVVADDGAVMLEVNAYPGLDDVVAAQDAFVAEAAKWWGSVAGSL